MITPPSGKAGSLAWSIRRDLPCIQRYGGNEAGQAVRVFHQRTFQTLPSGWSRLTFLVTRTTTPLGVDFLFSARIVD